MVSKFHKRVVAIAALAVGMVGLAWAADGEPDRTLQPSVQFECTAVATASMAMVLMTHGIVTDTDVAIYESILSQQGEAVQALTNVASEYDDPVAAIGKWHNGCLMGGA